MQENLTDLIAAECLDAFVNYPDMSVQVEPTRVGLVTLLTGQHYLIGLRALIPKLWFALKNVLGIHCGRLNESLQARWVIDNIILILR